ncbi:hypothetical protein Ahy_A05g024857 [Arachis hypogaea]|uniref:Uncharacterized protein n=1 Tax=Arachis hypogaea TaxID=3818 RepID=A0A445D6Z5_ARAHY|nr:hypothetical protein Ahy_A05g024857 [Arachis hypogaea]
MAVHKFSVTIFLPFIAFRVSEFCSSFKNQLNILSYVILADIGYLNSRKSLELVLMGIIRSCFSFIAGTVYGIYVAQNYQIPNITKLIDTTLHKAKQVEETYRKPKKKDSDDDNYD